MVLSRKWLNYSKLGWIALTGAVLGYWMDDFPGLILFMGFGVLSTIVFNLAATYEYRLTTAMVLLLAGTILYGASTLGWGGADAPDRTYYLASPVGLSHVLLSTFTDYETIDCGWYAVSRYPLDCRVKSGGEFAFALLRTVYPLVIFSAICCGVGALLSLGSTQKLRRYQSLLASCAAFAAVLAMVLFANSLGLALNELRGLYVRTGGFGMLFVTGTVVWCLFIALRR